MFEPIIISKWFQIDTIGDFIIIMCSIVTMFTLISISYKLTQIMKNVINIDSDSSIKEAPKEQ